MNECNGIALQHAADSLLMHTNAAHRPELRSLAASISDQRDSQIVDAELVFVCAHGFQVSWLDLDGGHIVPLSFDRPAHSSHDLAHLLGGYLCGESAS